MNILTTEQVARAIYVDADYDAKALEDYAKQSSSFIKNKTGYDFTKDKDQQTDLAQDKIEPLAVACATQYVKQLHFGAAGYNREHDYSLGINSLLVDLQVIAYALKQQQELLSTQ
jgi:hypothetical protein